MSDWWNKFPPKAVLCRCESATNVSSTFGLNRNKKDEPDSWILRECPSYPGTLSHLAKPSVRTGASTVELSIDEEPFPRRNTLGV